MDFLNQKISYSLHLSSKTNALSTSRDITKIEKHSFRKYEAQSENYNREKIHILRGSENLLTDIKEGYIELFSDAITDYNEKQEKAHRISRKIEPEDYFHKVSDTPGTDAACEMIIMPGDRDFWKDADYKQKLGTLPFFEDQINELEHLLKGKIKLISAVVHLDEASPHMHLYILPYSEGYKRGLSRQISKTKVFTKSSLSMLQDKMRKAAQASMDKLPVFKSSMIKDKEEGRNKDYIKDTLIKIKENEKELQGLNQNVSKVKSQLLNLEQQKSIKRSTLEDISNDVLALQEELEILQQQVELEKSNYQKEKKRYIKEKQDVDIALNRAICEKEKCLQELTAKEKILSAEVASSVNTLDALIKKKEIAEISSASSAIKSGLFSQKGDLIEINRGAYDQAILKAQDAIQKITLASSDRHVAESVRKTYEELVTNEVTIIERRADEIAKEKVASLADRETKVKEKEEKLKEKFKEYTSLESLVEERAIELLEKRVPREDTPEKFFIKKEGLWEKYLKALPDIIKTMVLVLTKDKEI